MKTSRILPIFLFISMFGRLCSQVNTVSYPVPFTQYYNNLASVNPAIVGYKSDLSAFMGHKRMLGNYSKISTYYFSAEYRITKEKLNGKKPFSALGLYVLNDREGKYLNRGRAYAVYAWHGFFARNIRFSGGFRIGGMNYNVKGTPLSGDGSDTSPDGSVGVSIYNRVFCAGVSYNQLFNSSVQPLEEVANLKPYVNVLGKSKLYKSELFLFEAAGKLFLPVSDETSTSEWDITGLGTVKEKIGVAIGIHNRDRIVTSVELKNLFSGSGSNILDIYLTYCYSTRTSIVNNNFFEFGLGYQF